MLTGLCRRPDGTIDSISAVEDVPRIAAQADAEVWLDLDQPTEDEVRAVGRAFDLDAEAVEDCLHGEQRPRIDEFDSYTFMVLHSAVSPESGSTFDPRKLAVFCSSNLLITVHREPLPSVRATRKRCEKNPAHMLERGVDFILYTIIDAMVDNYTLVADACETRLDELEDRSLGVDLDESLLTDSADLRRELLELRRLATAQRELLIPVAKGEYDHISESLEQRFSHVADHLKDAAEMVDALRERLNAVRDNYHTALANRTNAIMRTLTIFATIVLPLTLLAGIYGMNVPLWPPSDQPGSFWGILVAMLVITGAMLLIFRRRRWL